MKSLTIKEIDPKILKSYKVACAETGITMRDGIIHFMKHYGTTSDMKKIKTPQTG